MRMINSAQQCERYILVGDGLDIETIGVTLETYIDVQSSIFITNETSNDLGSNDGDMRDTMALWTPVFEEPPPEQMITNWSDSMEKEMNNPLFGNEITEKEA